MSGGGPAVVNLSGTKTIRLTMDGTVSKDERVVVMDYLLFVPVAPPVLVSSTTVNGTYTDAAGASVNTGTKTITVPVGGSANFYRIRGDIAYTITSINIVGPNVVITYN
jgi:hypothetical protein